MWSKEFFKANMENIKETGPVKKIHIQRVIMTSRALNELLSLLNFYLADGMLERL